MKKRDWDEFAENAADWSPDMNRREFLEMAAASLVLAGLTGCTRPPRDPVYPYVKAPEDEIPGRPTYFATARVLGGLATGILVETHQGRPTKIEGNPDHPASRGKAWGWTQASLLGLYDPERAHSVKRHDKASTWSDFGIAWEQAAKKISSEKNKSFIILSDLSTSPTLRVQIENLRKKFPALKWIQWEPQFRTAPLVAAKHVFGHDVAPIYHFDKADVVVSFDSDFLAQAEAPPAYAADFMRRRRQTDDGGTINQLFVAECSVSLTGLKSQFHVCSPSSDIEKLAEDLLEASEHPSDKLGPWLKSLVPLLARHSGRCAFIAGSQQSVFVHSVCHILNSRFGNQAVEYIDSPMHDVPDNLNSLIQDLRDHKVQGLLIAGVNPAYALPQYDWKALIKDISFSARLSQYDDETAAVCEWFLPQSDDFEAWSDALAFDGSTTVLQPVIEPLYDSRNIHEVVSLFQDSKFSTSHEILTGRWRSIFGNGFQSSWTTLLQKGVLAPPSKTRVYRPLAKGVKPSSAPLKSGEMEVAIRPGYATYDGRFGNNPWLQELPDPLTKICWGNVASVSEKWARDHSVTPGQILEIKSGERTLRAPAWIQEKLSDRSVVLTCGHGRKGGGRIATGKGYNAFDLAGAGAIDFLPASVRVTSDHEVVACTQSEQKMDGRDFAKSVNQLRSAKLPQSLYPESPTKDEDAWAMTIDLDSCTGCSACVIACQSENNIPVVGKSGILLGRQMHWIRVDRYVGGHFQPVPCMHCEKAPCEPVCPVGATVHGNGGLNQMVYNRCVGTRYCANNCPYKVRRFNFLNYTKSSDLKKLGKNPDVSIRPRGVMEKCTYCVQRINHKQIQARLEKRELEDGEVVTACQQTCPANAIIFGNLKDVRSQVSQSKNSPRNYALLEELGTRPRTTYLASLTDDSGAAHD